MRNELVIPDFTRMNDDEVRAWVGTLTTPIVYENLAPLTQAVIRRFGRDARIATSTFSAPKIIHIVNDSAQPTLYGG